MDLVKAGFLFLRQSVSKLGGPLLLGKKRLSDEPESGARCGKQSITLGVIFYTFPALHCPIVQCSSALTDGTGLSSSGSCPVDWQVGVQANTDLLCQY